MKYRIVHKPTVALSPYVVEKWSEDSKYWMMADAFSSEIAARQYCEAQVRLSALPETVIAEYPEILRGVPYSVSYAKEPREATPVDISDDPKSALREGL